MSRRVFTDAAVAHTPAWMRAAQDRSPRQLPEACQQQRARATGARRLCATPRRRSWWPRVVAVLVLLLVAMAATSAALAWLCRGTAMDLAALPCVALAGLMASLAWLLAVLFGKA